MPAFASTHVDSVLTRFSRQYPLGTALVQDLLFPRVPVSKETGLFFRYDKGDQARIPYTKRQIRSESRTVDWRVDTDTYACEEYALNDLIDDREYGQADTPLNLQRDTVMNLQRLMVLDREKRVHGLATDAAVITKNVTLTGTNQWRDAGAEGTTATPLADFEARAEAVRADTGVRPNTVVFGMQAWLAWSKTSDVMDRIITPGGPWGSPTITTDVARILLAPYGVTTVRVADQIENTAGFGATDSFSDIWTDVVGLYYITPTPGVKTVSFGYSFWSKAWQVRRARLETQHSDWFEPSYVVDEKVIAADVAALIIDVSDGS